jgi:hypothetical protein
MFFVATKKRIVQASHAKLTRQMWGAIAGKNIRYTPGAGLTNGQHWMARCDICCLLLKLKL